MPLLIKNGRIVTAADDYVADIWCEGETVTAIGPNLPVLPGAEVIDASGKYVFPGFIDPHVHIYLPFMGTFAKDTYATASRAALVGGTTTLIEMVCPARNDDPLEAYELWKSKAAGQSACDYAFHMGVTRFDDNTPEQLRRIVDDGTASFKIFLAYKGAFGIDDAELYRTLELAKRWSVIVTAHCENAELVAQLQARLLAEGKTGPEWHEPSRPTRVEAEGVHHLATFAGQTGAHVYVVHTSCDDALRAAEAARNRGVKMWVETVIPYLMLDKTFAEKPDFEGAKYVMSPPLRDKQNQPALWTGLQTGLISTVATDHAPFDFHGQKEMGRDDFTKIPNGIPSVEDRVNLLYTYGVCGRALSEPFPSGRGQGEGAAVLSPNSQHPHPSPLPEGEGGTPKLDLPTFVATASTNAAKLFGLFPRKGTIQPGSDADLVIYDPNYRGTISAKTQQMNVDYSAFEGVAIEGRPSAVTVRGKVQVRDGQFVGEQVRGQMLRRELTH